MAACLSLPIPETVPAAPRPAAVAPAMTRCECTEVSFENVAKMIAAGCTHEHAMASTGVGGTCTACRGDLELYLATLNLI